MNIIFGNRYVDIVTDFRGVATAEAHYWDGRHTVLLEGVVTPAGELPEYWVTVERVEPVSSEEPGQYA